MKKFVCGVVVLILTMMMTVTAFAQDYTDIEKDVKDDWYVTFRDPSNRELESNFKNNVLSDKARGMQPGDQITFKLKLSNQYKETTDWYMTNEVLSSLETSRNNSRSKGGAYTYLLTYSGPNSSEDEVLFSSETVGGDKKAGAREGLKEATDGLEKFFYLDTLKQGQEGYITLVVELDGETQGNDYQDTLAELKMNFAVELNTPTGNTPPTTHRFVKTGDDRNMLPYFAAMAASGIVVLIIAIVLVRRKKAEKEDRAA